MKAAIPAARVAAEAASGVKGWLVVKTIASRPAAEFLRRRRSFWGPPGEGHVTTTNAPGSTATEFYDIVSGTWSAGPHTAHDSRGTAFQVALPTGQVLIAALKNGCCTYTGAPELLGP